MAGITIGTQVPTAGQSFGLGAQGSSTRLQGTISIKAPVLQEYEIKDGKKSFIGEPIVGDEARKILASFMAANEDRRLERFKTQVDELAKKHDFVKKDRGLNDGETVEDRARRYILGMVISAINSAPSIIHVGSRSFTVSTLSRRVEYDPYELQEVLENKRSLGSGNKVLPTDIEGTSRGNLMIVSKDLLQKAVSYFVEKLQIRVQGNTLYANGQTIVSFTTADRTAQILSAIPSFDLEEIKVF